MKILLAEDDINLGKLLSMLLKKQNITVNWVQDGEAAYDAVYAVWLVCAGIGLDDAAFKWP